MNNKRTLQALALSLSLLLTLSPGAYAALTTKQAGQLLEEFYIDEVPPSVLAQPTIPEMLEALGDPYTEYFPPQDYQSFLSSMSDISLVGIGVTFQVTEEGLYLNEILEHSPAEAGGLRPGDLIIAIDGRSVLGQDSDTITGWIRGEEGSTVSVTYLREGQKETTVTLVRALVVVAATTTQLIDDHIGYIRCSTFGDETYGHFKEGMETYGDKATVWIVDLRSNLGGSTEAATNAAGLFAGSGEMAYLRDGSNQYGAYFYSETPKTLYPVIVLMDFYSASSSELFASIIRDYQAGIIIGSRSYGKGVAQQVLDQQYDPELFADGDAIKITSHRFYSPAGNTTDQIGVIPDLLVPPEMAGNVAYLLAGSAPTSDTSGTLKVDLGWRWYVDLQTAINEDPEALQLLLNDLPVNKDLWLGTGGPNGWQRTDAASVAREQSLEYTLPQFSDQSESLYDTALSVLKTFFLIHGREDGAFHPRDTLTRAELCQLLAIALNCTVPEGESSFTDVPADAWYTPAIVAMTQLGLVNGTGDGTFSPDSAIDHQQFITIMGRLSQRLNMYFYNAILETPAETINTPELSGYADWAKPSAWLLSYSQKGYFGNTLSLLWADAADIEPLQFTTRDEAAYTIYRILSYTGILPA